MGDDLYRLIPEEGKHLAESHDTEGAFRGVYLDDETNKPSGAGEFVKVDLDDLIEHDDDQVLDTPSDSSDGAAIGLLSAAGAFVLGVIATKAAPHVKKWATEKAGPAIKRLFKKDHTDDVDMSESTELSEKVVSEQATLSTEVSIDVAYNEYRENMSSEEAQRELVEAFILYLESMRKVKRVANANVIDSNGMLSDGKVF